MLWCIMIVKSIFLRVVFVLWLIVSVFGWSSYGIVREGIYLGSFLGLFDDR